MDNLSAEQRKELLDKLENDIADNLITIGELVKKVRTQLYDMTQIQYAEFIKVSDKTLRDIEKGNTDTRVSVLNKVLAPGGFTLSARAHRTRL
ncbi:helix-turn-helix domain-containing protein [Glaciecola petra]|uniref:Helix-turn-helix transcriptional regulator n=1 Tax=Glaciecola petra TaxID=3075602 RepID=A0ABU2ZLU1_9ALTE|nr:helix-turn-helix transcriptional regulator [Aestuariibacter sp. P117]MDT0593304.1 helix-turn-helix transcriptional regulator [Aestuariibacter sp. P117]